MSSEWPLVRLGDYVDSCLGKMLDAKKNKGIPQPYLGNSNVRWGAFELTDLAEMKFEPHEEERYGLLPGDLVVCEGGEPGRCAIWTGAAGMKVQKALHRIRTKPQLNNYFLYYWFCYAARNEALEAYFTGTTIKHLTGKAIAELKVPLPPLSVQEGITDILKCLDDRITLLRETNSTLEAIAQALFKSWFVDFDPVHAKHQGRAPEGMDAQTAALFPDAFEESELGMVPKGWRVGTLGDIAQTIKKQISSEQLHSGLNYVGLEHIPRKSLSLTAWNNAEGLESAKAKFGVGDVLFGKLRPYFHKVVIAPVDGVCSTDILVCSPKKPEYYGLVAMQLFSKELIDYADRLSNGAKMPRVNWSDLAAYPLAIPPEEISSSYTKFSKEIFEKMQQGVHQMQTLAKLRDTLLPRLISGQLRLPEAQALVEDTVDA